MHEYYAYREIEKTCDECGREIVRWNEPGEKHGEDRIPPRRMTGCHCGVIVDCEELEDDGSDSEAIDEAIDQEMSERELDIS